MKNIFITGISGLLGTNLVNLLLEQNYRVTGLIRNPDSFTGTRNENLTLLKGGLFDDYSTIFSDIDIVIHIAAETISKIYFSMKIIIKPTTKLHVIYMKLP